MLNPVTKAKLLTLTNVSAQILVTSNFFFGTWAQQNLPFTVANVTYGLSQNEYNFLFVPDVADLGPTTMYGLGIGPTLTTSTAKEISNRINKFVANVSASY